MLREINVVRVCSTLSLYSVASYIYDSFDVCGGVSMHECILRENVYQSISRLRSYNHSSIAAWPVVCTRGMYC